MRFAVPSATPSEPQRLAITPLAACRIHLVRHGTTRMNVENRYRGRRDVPLDAQGYQDAVDAARRLSGVGLTAVYTGPLRRTIATAQVVADEAGVPDLRILHGLVNLDYGTWEGLTAAEAAAQDEAAFGLYRTSPQHAVCPDGERLTTAQERMLAALRLIAERHRDENVAAISHAVMIRLVLTAIERLEGERWRVPIERGSVTVIEIDEDGPRLVGLAGRSRGDLIGSPRVPATMGGA
jgi:broad specificity phosphatase PhoE